MASPTKHRLVIPSCPSHAAQVIDAIASELSSHGFDRKEQFAVRLAMDEAMANAIRHGNCNDAKKQVTVEYSVDDQQCWIRVSDEGPGFDPRRVPDPTRDENLERPCGRGVMLMRNYMTQVQYNPQGNGVTMTKVRQPSH